MMESLKLSDKKAVNERKNDVLFLEKIEKVSQVFTLIFNLFSLSALFAAHFVLVFCILLFEPTVPANNTFTSSIFSLKPYIALYNGLFLAALFWSIAEKYRSEPLQLATALNLGSIWCDLVVAGSYRDFRVWILFLNILFRFFTSFLLFRHWHDRNQRLLMATGNRKKSVESRLKSLERRNVIREYQDMSTIPIPRSLFLHQDFPAKRVSSPEVILSPLDPRSLAKVKEGGNLQEVLSPKTTNDVSLEMS